MTSSEQLVIERVREQLKNSSRVPVERERGLFVVEISSRFIAFFELFVITCSLHGTRAVAGKILPALKLKHFEKGYIIGQACAGANHRGHLGGACTRAVRSPGISALRASPPAGPEAPRRATSGQTRAHEPKRVPTRSASTREQKTPLLPWPMQLISASPSARAERRHP